VSTSKVEYTTERTSVEHEAEKVNLRVLFLTRKHPPSVGGMEKFSKEIVTYVGELVESRVIAWGGSQRWLPWFMVYSFVCGLWHGLTWRPHIIHIGDGVMCLVGVPLARLIGAKAIVNIHGLDVTYSKWGYQALVLPWIRQADRIICISSATKRECVNRGVLEEKICVIPPGVAEDDAERMAEEGPIVEAVSKERGRYPEGARVLLTVGRLVRRKGVEWFIREVLPLLVKRGMDVYYWVVGDGPERENITAAIAETGLDGRVKMWGKVDDETLRSIYRTADLFVMPNIPVPNDMEGFGLVAVEASLAGLMTVATRLEGINDAVREGENGVLANALDSEALAAAVIDVLQRSDSRTRERKRQIRDAVIRRLGWMQIREDYVGVFGDLLQAQKQ